MDMIREASHIAASASLARAMGEVLSFRLGEQEYGIDNSCVQEIRSYEVPTQVANAPPCIKGVINLRGAIVPIVDLRLMVCTASSAPDADDDRRSVVMVLNVDGRVIGTVVDAVCEVLSLPAPVTGTVHESRPGVVDPCVWCTIDVDGRRLIVLNIEALMGGTELGLIARAG